MGWGAGEREGKRCMGHGAASGAVQFARGSHSSVSPTSLHLLVFLSFLTRESKHRLRCLIHNKSDSANVSFPVIEGQLLKSATERISQKKLRGLGALGFGPRGGQDLRLPVRPVLSF